MMYSASTSTAPGEVSLVTTLVVDDEEPVRGTLQRFLTSIGHEVVTADSAAGALGELARRKVSCILLDVRLPDGSGLDLVPTLIAKEPHVAILMLTAVNDAHSAALCMQRGAMDYLVKPVDLSELERAIARALARRRDLIEQAETQAWLQREIVQRGAELRRERGNLERISVATLEALVNALEAKDPYLRGHSARVADLSAMVAAELGLNDEQVELVRTAGRLHDIGKIGIRESVLGKRGPLSEEEFEHVRSHVTIGAQILAPLTHLRDVIGYVRSHHERADGTGYPDGLSGDAIPIGARILGAAEVYDALTTARPYQEKMSPEEAVGRMRDLTGTVIDGDVHRALAAVVARRKTLVFLDERESLQ
ncbi:MAG TPA: HD domain-containing phosphohydrolase [Vicinamibacterales bacterium]|jgi:putative nucleotidyltransferase with HDIG domain